MLFVIYSIYSCSTLSTIKMNESSRPVIAIDHVLDKFGIGDKRSLGIKDKRLTELGAKVKRLAALSACFKRTRYVETRIEPEADRNDHVQTH